MGGGYDRDGIVREVSWGIGEDREAGEGRAVEVDPRV